MCDDCCNLPIASTPITTEVAEWNEKLLETYQKCMKSEMDKIYEAIRQAIAFGQANLVKTYNQEIEFHKIKYILEKENGYQDVSCYHNIYDFFGDGSNDTYTLFVPAINRK